MKRPSQHLIALMTVALVLSAAPGLAAEGASEYQLHDRANSSYRTVIHGGPAGGAARADSIVVLGGGLGNGNFEGPAGAPDFDGWTPVDLTGGVGNFAQVLNNLSDIDQLHSNFTAQVTFLDDGTVEPTGGYPCITWCYGAGGYIVNPEGGLLGPDYGIHNEIWSPVFERFGQPYFGATLAFDVYVHLPHDDVSPHISYTWRVRSTTSPDPQDLDSAPWLGDGLLYHGPDPQYLRFETDLTLYLEPGWEHAQVALGVVEPDPYAGGDDGTPAPYFDNVVVKIHEITGPALTAREAHLAQDAFPEIGVIDYINLGQNHVRFDMARNISPPEHLRNDPGDTVVVAAAAVRPGSVLEGLPELYYKLQRNPLFDPYRWAGLPDEGSIVADSCYAPEGGTVPDRFCFHVPDDGFLYPGDVLHYYIEARDNDMGDIGTTILPADTSGFSRFDATSAYDGAFIMRALPTVFSDIPDYHPPVLFINDNPKGGNDNEWHIAMRNLGMAQGVDYDTYWVNEPAAGVGNGIGGRATPIQLAEYEHVLYTCGDLSEITLSNGDFNADPGDDLGVLDSWMQIGDRRLMACGDNLVDDLVNRAGVTGAAFTAVWLSVSWVADDVTPLINGQDEPTVAPILGNPVFFHPATTSWPLLGLRPWKHRFDAVTTVVPAVSLAGFLTPAGIPNTYPYSAATLHSEQTFLNEIISLPYDLASIGYSGVPDPLATRTRVLEDILLYFGYLGSQPPDGIPDLNLTTATTAAIEPVVVLNSPDGQGHRFDQARTMAGTVMGATITVNLLDGNATPIPDYPAEDIWLETDQGGLVTCLNGAIADHDTDQFGATTFIEPIAGGGYSNFGSEMTQVVINGLWLTQPPLPIDFQSFDLNGDLDVDFNDMSNFFTDRSGPYDLRSDFYLDGVIDFSDYILMVQGYGRSCQISSLGPIPLPAAEPLPAATLGLYWDPEGTEQIKFANPGELLTGYLLLKPSEDMALGGLACRLPFDPGDFFFTSITWHGIADGSDATGYEVAFSEPLSGGPDAPIEVASVIMLLQSPNTIVIEPDAHVSYSDIVQGEPGGTLSYNVTSLQALVNPDLPGTVIVLSDPDLPPTQWHLTNGQDLDLTSWGDTTLVDMTPADYTLTWLDVDCWQTPGPNPEVQTLAPDGEITFEGTYMPLGTVVMNPEPDEINAGWDLEGDLGYNLTSAGDTTLTCLPPDNYTLTWHGVPDWFAPEPNPTSQILGYGETITFTGTYLTARTDIASITDVPNDHGRNLRLEWERSYYDAPDNGVDITGYGVYRRQDEYKGLDRKAGEDPMRLEGWDFISMVPAHGDSLYQIVAPTLCDSTDLGICWSVFFLRTMTPDPFTYWDSPPDSGYSIDNLVPVVPGGFAVAYAAEGNALDWDDNPDPDIRNYNIYRGALDDCTFPGGEPDVQVATPGWFDDLSEVPGHAWEYCYFVTAVDFAGNESEPTVWAGAYLIGLAELQVPAVFALHPCSPNPFNPQTVIRFDLPRAGRVDMAVFDISGRLVRRLITAETWTAGRHEVTWTGIDDHGRRVASGVYFCRLQADNEMQIQRMALVK